MDKGMDFSRVPFSPDEKGRKFKNITELADAHDLPLLNADPPYLVGFTDTGKCYVFTQFPGTSFIHPRH